MKGAATVVRKTIHDIAKISGFSKSTVSRVLMADSRVKPDTRDKIQKIIDECHFERNEIARGMAMGSLRIVMIVAGDIASYFYGVTVKELEKILFGAGYLVVVCTSEYSAEKELSYLNMARLYRMSGVVLMTAIESEELIRLIGEADCPVILINRYLNSCELDAVVQDNFQCAYLATKHLIDMGHRRILHISSGQGATTSRDRQAGFLAALQDAGCPVTPDMVVYGDLTWLSGYGHARVIVENGRDYTAAFIGNDMMTVGFVKGWLECGRKIPEDISLICFDPSPFIEQLPVRMSTVGRPAEDLGVIAGKFLLERLAGSQEPLHRIVLQPLLQIRESVKKIC
ncbi:MAG TPA: hypothetical protein DD640_08900 [Clostridiales bacterium]|nr:hypothetical protein [Clostridiales bacterium]